MSSPWKAYAEAAISNIKSALQDTTTQNSMSALDDALSELNRAITELSEQGEPDPDDEREDES